jgi:hypothetical protein
MWMVYYIFDENKVSNKRKNCFPINYSIGSDIFALIYAIVRSCNVESWKGGELSEWAVVRCRVYTSREVCS